MEGLSDVSYMSLLVSFFSSVRWYYFYYINNSYLILDNKKIHSLD